MVLCCTCTNPGKIPCRKPPTQSILSVSSQSTHPRHVAKTVKNSRRDVMTTFTAGLVAVTPAITTPEPAHAGGLGSYLKKKALDPLDSYVIPLITAKKELKSSGKVAETDVKEARSMLRSVKLLLVRQHQSTCCVGALSGYRMNVRAVGEYAERLETVPDPKKLVDTAIRDLENFDSSLLLLLRGESSQEEAKKLLKTTLIAIDSLLESVPQEVMQDVTGGTPFQEAAPQG